MNKRPVKHKAETLARTECRMGHPWIPENLRVAPNGGLTCKLCTKDSIARAKARKKKEYEDIQHYKHYDFH